MVRAGAAAWLAALLCVLAGRADAQVVSPRRLLEVVDIGNPVISPDGRYVAFRTEQANVERNRYDTAWYVQRIDGTLPPVRVADGGSPLREYVSGVVKPAPAEWSPDGRWIYYRALISGMISVWRAAADGSGAHAITSDAADVREFVLGPGGDTVQYSVGATREQVLRAEQMEYDQGIHINDRVFIGAGLFRSSRLEERLATQRFVGDWFTTGPLLADVPNRWKIVHLDGETPREAQVSDPPRQLSPLSLLRGMEPEPWRVALHPDDDRVAILTRVGDAPKLLNKPDVELAVLPNGEGAPIRCGDTLCTGASIHDIRWRPGSDEVLFTAVERNEGRARSVLGWNVATGQVRTIVKARGLIEGSSQRPREIPCGLSSLWLACVTAEADQPPRLERIDLETGERGVLFEPNAALAADMVANTPASMIRWTDRRGRTFSGYLFESRRRDTSVPPPLFVTFYTCEGFLRGGVGDEWPLATLAGHGISALCINGPPGQHIDITEHYGQGLLAVESIVEQLQAAGRIDPDRVGMGGLSYGNEVMLWTAMHSNLLAAASSASPSVTPTWYLFNSLRPSFRDSAERLWQLGIPTDTPTQWKAISPTFNLERLQVPILFQLVEQEYLMALDYAIPLVRAGQADIYVFPNEPHIKIQPRHKMAVYTRNVDWFRFWLQDYEDPDPSKVAQYAHWRTLRNSVHKRPAAAAGNG